MDWVHWGGLGGPVSGLGLGLFKGFLLAWSCLGLGWSWSFGFGIGGGGGGGLSPSCVRVSERGELQRTGTDERRQELMGTAALYLLNYLHVYLHKLLSHATMTFLNGCLRVTTSYYST